jgi:hypothetical protein
MNDRLRRSIRVLVLATAPAHAAPLAFTDVTEQAGLAVHHDYLFNASTGREMGSGGAVADFNNDGWQDIFFLSGGHALDSLFINNGDGTFTDRAAQWGLARFPHHIGSAALAADLNSDGYTDLYITSHGPALSTGTTGAHRLLLNIPPGPDGVPHFIEVAPDCGVETTSTLAPDGFGAAAGDIDLDGDLDLAVAGWLPLGHNLLFRNISPDQGALPFYANDTASIASPFQTGNALNTSGFSPRIIDLDADWRPEILWISDFSTSRYLRNNPDGSFSDITAQTGTGLDQNGMGVTTGDFDNDGRPDFYVTAILQPDFQQYPREGNRLYLNQGDHTFTEAALATGAHDGRWGWGATAADFDHDADLDIAEVNGWNAFPQFVDQPAILFQNLLSETGVLRFRNAEAESGFDHTSDARGIARIDFDNDGDQDALIFSRLDRLTLLRNDLITDGVTPEDANWLRVFVDTGARPALAPEGVGAVVTIKTVEGDQRRTLDAGPTFQTTEERSAHFGLGAADTVLELDVEFHDGTRLRLENIPANQTVTVTAPPCRADLAQPFGVRDLADIHAFAGYFLSGARAANLADPVPDPHDAPVLDLADILAFVAQFRECE